MLQRKLYLAGYHKIWHRAFVFIWIFKLILLKCDVICTLIKDWEINPVFYESLVFHICLCLFLYHLKWCDVMWPSLIKTNVSRWEKEQRCLFIIWLALITWTNVDCGARMALWRRERGPVVTVISMFMKYMKATTLCNTIYFAKLMFLYNLIDWLIRRPDCRKM